jgi:hypothetical protein
MIRNGFRVSPADHPWQSMTDPRTIGKWVGRGVVCPGVPQPVRSKPGCEASGIDLCADA